MTNSEMLKALEENPKRIAKCINTTIQQYAYFKDNILIWLNGVHLVLNFNYEWEIIEPELVKKLWINGK